MRGVPFPPGCFALKNGPEAAQTGEDRKSIHTAPPPTARNDPEPIENDVPPDQSGDRGDREQDRSNGLVIRRSRCAGALTPVLVL